MTAELQHKRFRGKWIRIHDAGDFFSDDYLMAWLRIMAACPDVHFYAYTKEVQRFRRLVEPGYPWNFKFVYSMGGKHDSLLDPAYDRVADVFVDEEDITEQGWHSQQADDRLAVLGPAPVGMASNRIPHLRKRQGNHRFSELQQAKDEKTLERRNRRKAGRRMPAAGTMLTTTFAEAVSDRARLPVWTPLQAGDLYFYEAVDSRGLTWRMWPVRDDNPGDGFPSGWRYAPVDELEQAHYVPHLGALRELDLAALRIDPLIVAADPRFRHWMGWDDDQQAQEANDQRDAGTP